MKKYLPIALLIIIFFVFKLSNLGIRLSDSNIYFYTGYKILQGQILYKDIFATNFPLFPYLSAFYYLLTFGNLKLFFLIPTIEVGIVTFLIHQICYRKYQDISLSVTASTIYLFSFIILSTSDHQTGVFISSVFATVSYYFYINKKYFLTGIFIALTFLTKAYFLPILLSYIVLFFWKKEYKNILPFFAGAIITSIVIMLPTIIFALPNFIKDTFVYSLNRTQGVEKSNIVWFFITHDFSLLVLLLFNLFTIKKNKLIGLTVFFGIIFFFIYRDMYYLYLNFLIPFLCLSYPDFYKFMEKNFNIQKYIIPSICLCLLVFNAAIYMTDFRNLGKIDLEQAVQIIKKEKPRYLYGIDSITPALSFLSDTPLLDNIVDTNANIYRKGFLSAHTLTSDAIKQKAVIIAHGASYPQNGINIEVTDEIFDMALVKKSCKLIGSFPVQTEGTENRLNILRC